ncbi:MAG: fibronectin type III domain-containing protein [Saprospiraceae bacterium]
MKKHTVALFVYWVVLAWPQALIGQDTLFIQAVAQSTPNAIKIRWAPNQPLLWQWCNEVGYTIERLTLYSDEGKLLSTAAKMASIKSWSPPFRPLPAEAWKPLVDTNEVAGMAAAALFGENFALQDVADHPMIRIYSQVQEQENRFGFGLFAADQDWNVADAMGLAFIDTTVVMGETYLYYIKPAIFPTSFSVKPATLSARAIDALPLLKPTGLQANFGDHLVELKWEANDRPVFSSYIIERSLDGGQQFNRVNSLPIVPTAQTGSNFKLALYKDTLTENFQNIVYRLKGKTIFGEFSPPSDTISGYGKPAKLEASLGIYHIQEVQAGQLQIKWDFPVKFNEHLKGFEVYRSQTKQGPFQKINKTTITASGRQFTDASPYSTNYYQVKAYDLYGHIYQSFSALGQLLDETPPAPPLGLQGTITKDGQVSLHWHPNNEADHMGYRVFRSNQKEGFYNQVTAFYTRDTFYHHQIDMRTSSQSVYYKVIALDFRENYSEYSAFCEIKRPDLIPPIAPVIKQIKPQKEGVMLEWILSSSEDIARHELQRKAAFEESWKTLVRLEKTEKLNHFIDSTASYRHDYTYRLLAIDESGLETSSKMLSAHPLDLGYRALIENFEASVDTMSGTLRLHWKYPPEPELFQFVLYRGEAMQPLRTYKHISPLEAEGASAFQTYHFEENHLKKNTRYTYQLIAKFKEGGYSPLSAKIEIGY